MKNNKKNDTSAATRVFFELYGSIFFCAWSLPVLFFKDNFDVYNLPSGMIILIIANFFVMSTVITRMITKCVIKEFQITKTFKSNLKLNLTLAIIASAIVLIFSFLYLVKLAKETDYKVEEYFKEYLYMFEEITGEERLIEKQKGERKTQITITGAITISSMIAIFIKDKTIEKYCKEDELEHQEQV